THDPHDVPARVHPLIAPTLSQPSSTIALLMAPFVTALQEQIWASSGSASTPTALSPPPAGPISAAGSPGSSLPTSGRRSVYSLASPTSTPPSSVLASSETTSFLYDPATASLTTTSSAPSVAAWASPKLATSTPINFSFVEVSAPGNEADAPSRAAAATSAIE